MQLSLGLVPVSSLSLTLEEFLQLEYGNVLVSPEGNVFTYGEMIEEIVPTEVDKEAEIEIREFNFLDTGDSLRNIKFHAGVSVYGILISSYGKVDNTTGIQKRIGIEYDEEWNQFVDDETGFFKEEE